jgi:cytochrome c biogenesis protein CcdA
MEDTSRMEANTQKNARAVTSPFGAFIMGFAVCLFELPCTGGPYIVILGLLAERTTMIASIPILLLYNCSLCSPFYYNARDFISNLRM